MWWAPATLETASSIVLVTCDSSSAGAAPNWVIDDGDDWDVDVRHARDRQLVEADAAERDDGGSHDQRAEAAVGSTRPKY